MVGLRGDFGFCAQARIIAQGGRPPKRDIVDTTFHASCADGQISAKGSALPTLWEEQVRAGVKGCRNSTWADIEVGTHVCLGIINAPA